MSHTKEAIKNIIISHLREIIRTGSFSNEALSAIEHLARFGDEHKDFAIEKMIQLINHKDITNESKIRAIEILEYITKLFIGRQ